MEKSFNSPEVDIETNSIFDRRSNASSPFHLGLKYKTINCPLTSAKTPGPIPADFFAPLFPPLELGTIPNSHLSSVNYKTPPNKLIKNEELDNELRDEGSPASEMHGDSHPRVFTPKSKQTRDAPSQRIESLESIMSTAITTKSMILIRPMNLPDVKAPNYDERTDTQDHSNKSVTTFFLKAFNAFTRNGGSLLKPEAVVSDNAHPAPRTRRAKRCVVGPLANKQASQAANPAKAKKSGCTCKNSSCIKMYCECFRTNGACSPECSCLNCKNVEGNTERELMVDLLIKRQQISEQQDEISEADVKVGGGRGCNCKKSMCQKKYCECFNQGAFCNPECCCANCLNVNK